MSDLELPLRARRIVIGAGSHAGVAAWIRERRPDLELRGAAHTEVTPADLEWGEVYVGFRRPPSAATLGNVRWVHCTGAGVDSWLVPPALDGRVLLTRTPESFGPMIAEWVVARVFAIQQQLGELAEAQRERRWAPRDLTRVAGTRALVLGTGDVGTAVAAALAALGCRVTGVSRSGRSGHPAFASVHPASALGELVGDADWIVLTLPDTPATRGMFSRAVMQRCRGAALLNAGRGSAVDEGALLEALDCGWLRAAALDVFALEPLPESSPLWCHPRVTVSPHVAGLTTIEGAAQGFLACLQALEHGELPRWVVDRDRGY